MLKVSKNPVSGIQVKIRKSSVLHGIVNYEKLVHEYGSFAVYDNRTKRNKVILGVLIYQGVTMSELQALRVEDVQIKQQQIYIRSTRISNARTLKLVANQLLDLQEYLLVIRPNMLQSIEKKRPGRRASKVNPQIKEKLFFSEQGSIEIKNSLKHLFRHIQKSNPQITSSKVIRSTVIAEWLKTIDVRKVQYMCGHKYVSSTERYKAFNLDELKEALGKYHPLK
jgi:integrase/recombinase XerD